MKESFSGIADTRQQAQVRRDLYEIIAMTIAAVIGNSDGWDEIEDFCRNKEVWLREHMKLELEHGISFLQGFRRAIPGQGGPDRVRKRNPQSFRNSALRAFLLLGNMVS